MAVTPDEAKQSVIDFEHRYPALHTHMQKIVADMRKNQITVDSAKNMRFIGLDLTLLHVTCECGADKLNSLAHSH